MKWAVRGKRLLIVIIAVALVATAGIWGWRSYQGRAAGATAEPVYQQTEVRPGDIVLSASTSGTVSSRQVYDLHSEAAGRITRILAKEGDAVVRGQVVAKLDGTDARSNLAVAADNLSVAKSRLEQTVAQAKLEPVRSRLETEQATANLLSAQAKLDALKAGAKPQEVEQARSAVRQAQANLDAAQADYGRMKALFAEGGVSKQQVDAAQNKYLTAVESVKTAQQKLELLLAPSDPSELAAAEAALRQAQVNVQVAKENAQTSTASTDLLTAQTQVRQAESAYAEAQQALNATSVKAPIGGVLVSLAAKEGDYVAAQSVLGTISDLQRLKVDAYVDETEMAKVRVGQEADITADAFPDDTFSGRVTGVAPEGRVTDNIVSFLVTIDIQDARNLLKPGMTVDAEIISQRRTNVLLIPNTALADRRGRTMARVIEGGKPVYKRVELGITDGHFTEVVSGLKRGDVVASEQAGATGSQSTQSQNGLTGNRGGGIGPFGVDEVFRGGGR